MSTAAIVVLVVVGVLALLFVGGLLATRRRDAARRGQYARHVAEADQALEAARAADKGWDRALLEEAARSALSERRPGWEYAELHLVLVDDRPGVEEDRAHFVAAGRDGDVRVVLARRDGGWALEEITSTP